MTYAEWIANYVASKRGFVRGKCAEATITMVAAFPELRRAAGFVHVLWPTGPAREQHWWCIAPDGTVVDPTRAQFALVFEYEELNLDDPETHKRVPTGVCCNCGEDTYEGREVCSDVCSRAYIAYLNMECR